MKNRLNTRLEVLVLAFTAISFASFGQQRMTNDAFRIGGDKAGRDALGLCCSVQASLGNNPAVMNAFGDFRTKIGMQGFTKASAYNKVQGSAYLDPEFKKGVIFDGAEEVATFYVRYDAFNDDFEVKRNRHNLNVEALIRNESVSCQVSDQRWYYKSFQDSEKNRMTGYVVPIFEGQEYTLYLRKRKIYRKGAKAKTSFGTSFPDRFVDKIEYYVARNRGLAQYVKLRKKEVLTFVNVADRKKIANFIKDKGLKFEDQTDLKLVFQEADKLHNGTLAVAD